MEIENSDVIDILLVEDNPADVRLTQEAMRDSKLLNRLTVVPDGVEAMAYLKREREYSNATRPDLILLDLNLPKKDGREVLAELKADENLKSIPVVVLTTSEAHTDIVKSYNLHANCYISKPVELEKFLYIVRVIENFWFGIVKLPSLKTQDAT
jgi:two-component system, chemotaxis family, response regulator Rcp1